MHTDSDGGVLILRTYVTRPLCLVESHTLDAAAKRVRSFVLRLSHSVTPTPIAVPLPVFQ